MPEGDCCGHEHQHVWTEQPDPELTEVGSGSSCGEYLRRYWMPESHDGETAENSLLNCLVTFPCGAGYPARIPFSSGRRAAVW